MGKRDEVPGLPERLKAAREKAELSQVGAAEVTGIHQANISAFERGTKTPTVATLMTLAAAYGVRTCDLIPEPLAEPAPEPPPAKKPPAKKGKK